jgi:hypothetical protein
MAGFGWDYWRIAASVYMLETNQTDYFVYADIDMPPISYNEIFDMETIRKLNLYGIVLSYHDRYSYENGFMIVSKHDIMIDILKKFLFLNKERYIQYIQRKYKLLSPDAKKRNVIIELLYKQLVSYFLFHFTLNNYIVPYDILSYNKIYPNLINLKISKQILINVLSDLINFINDDFTEKYDRLIFNFNTIYFLYIRILTFIEYIIQYSDNHSDDILYFDIDKNIYEDIDIDKTSFIYLNTIVDGEIKTIYTIKEDYEKIGELTIEFNNETILLELNKLLNELKEKPKFNKLTQGKLNIYLQELKTTIISILGNSFLINLKIIIQYCVNKKDEVQSLLVGSMSIQIDIDIESIFKFIQVVSSTPINPAEKSMFLSKGNFQFTKEFNPAEKLSLLSNGDFQFTKEFEESFLKIDYKYDQLFKHIVFFKKQPKALQPKAPQINATSLQRILISKRFSQNRNTIFENTYNRHYLKDLPCDDVKSNFIYKDKEYSFYKMNHSLIPTKKIIIPESTYQWGE